MKFYKYFFKRVLISIATIFGVIVITFFISRLLPGDPVWARLWRGATLEDYLNERERLGLDKPLIVQFFVYIGDIFTGNWGFSYVFSQNYPIWELVMQHLPRTLEIMFISLFIAIILGIMLGKTSGVHRNGFRDIIFRIFTYIFVSIPGFVVIVFFMQLYVYTPFRLFPLYGYKTVGYPEPPLITGIRSIDCLISGKWYLFIDYIWHITVPVATMVIIQMVILIRQTRASVIEALQSDYVQLATAKGNPKKKVLNKHVLKNALPPVITTASMQFPIVVGGMVAVEMIYNFIGLGYLFQHAVIMSDYPLMIAIIFVFSLLVIISNFIADLLIVLIDPRIKLK
ncbi:MAG: ABC transporter permease [Promethearchaeota archaeon]